MQSITKHQLTELYTLLNQQFYSSLQKMLAVFHLTGIANPKKLSEYQATELIKYLTGNDSCDRMIKHIWALAYEEKIVSNSFTDEDEILKPFQLQEFLFVNNITDRDINTLSQVELQNVVLLLQQKIQDKHIQEANESTKSLFQELNIQVEKT
jgi:hypothetical protein